MSKKDKKRINELYAELDKCREQNAWKQDQLDKYAKADHIRLGLDKSSELKWHSITATTLDDSMKMMLQFRMADNAKMPPASVAAWIGERLSEWMVPPFEPRKGALTFEVR